MISWESKGIDLGRYAGRTSGWVKTLCPECSEGRKNKHEKCLSVNLETGQFKCHNCGWHGYATVHTDEEKEAWMRQQPWFRDFTKKRSEQPKRTYDRPPKARTGKMDAKTIAFFAKRGISEKTLEIMRVSDGTDWMPARVIKRKDGTEYTVRDKVGRDGSKGDNCLCIHFNYYRDGELIATKLRSGDKCFRQAKANCEQIAYNLDGIKNTEDCYIVEGEMDALSLAEIGYTNVISVPDGGNDKAMHWLIDYYEEYFANKKTIYICSDNDLTGSGLCAELQKHFDPGSYVIVTDYGTKPDGTPCKDANDCLMYCGPDTLRKKLDEGRTVRPEGDADMERLGLDLDDLYANGLPKGVEIGFANLNQLVRLEKGRLVIITGTPGSGKSQFLDQVAEKMNYHHGWRFSMFSPEMMPLSLHMAMLVSKFTGKHFDRESINPDLYQKAKERVMDAVHFIDPDSYDLDGILAIAKYQVRKYGCDALVLDPWNDLTMNGEGITKTDDINTALLKILTFTQQQHIVTFVMAHPSKVARNKDGTVPKISLSDISGSIHFYNRADIGIVLTRHSEEGRDYTELTVQKMRFANLGKVGDCYFKYQVGVGRFHPYDPALDTTDWDETNHIEERVVQTAITMPAAAAPSEANVQGFLQQAERADREQHRPTSLEDNDDLPFDNNEETPF